MCFCFVQAFTLYGTPSVTNKTQLKLILPIESIWDSFVLMCVRMCVSLFGSFVAQSTHCQREAAGLAANTQLFGASHEFLLTLFQTIPREFHEDAPPASLCFPCCSSLADEALWLAAVAAGDPFVRRANPTPGAIVLRTTAPNGDAAPPTPAGQALTSAPSTSNCHPSFLEGCFVASSRSGSLT